MESDNEYHDDMVNMLQLIWGEGTMAPGEVGREYDLIRGKLYPHMVELLGQESADHFVENWRGTMVVCEKGEMRQGYSRGRRPA